MTHIISLGAGVQSSTMALMAAAGEITPMPDCAIFADTQAEPRKVYEWLDWLEKQLPFPVHRVTRGSLTEAITTLRERKDKKGFWIYSSIPTFNINPDGSNGHMHRQCTTSFKIDVLDGKARAVIGRAAMLVWRQKHKQELKLYSEFKRAEKIARKEKRSLLMSPEVEVAWNLMQDDVLVTQWIGISTDESHRMKPSRHPWSVHRWPLVENNVSRAGCLEWMQAHGYPKPPRSACVYCPYHSDAEWRRLKTEAPEDFAEAVRVDKLYRELKIKTGVGATKQRGVPYLHDSRKPLDEVDFRTAEDAGQQSMFDEAGFNLECEGMCGL